MLDTNVFNHLLNGKVALSALEGKDLVATHVQRDELQSTKDEVRRAKLLRVFQELPTEQVPTSSAAWGVSRWGQARWGADDGIHTALRAELDALNKRKQNNIQDILIAETSFRNGWILVTSDADLFAVVTRFNGACINLAALSTV